MAQDFSFDVVSEIDLNVVAECVQVAMKEISNRFDFKGSSAGVELDPKAKSLTVRGEDEFRINQVLDILDMRMAKRGLPLQNFKRGKVESALGASARMPVAVQTGIPSDKAKEIVAAIKAAQLKANASIQGEQVRVSSRSKDELQSAINLLKSKDFGLALQFKNFR